MHSKHESALGWLGDVGARSVPLASPRWPTNADVAVSLTFDVDTECVLMGRHDAAVYQNRLTSLSEWRYGANRGLTRVLALLEEMDILATFFAPGGTIEQHPSAIKAIAAAGHEIAHHGYLHRRCDQISEHLQREEFLRGLDAIVGCFGEAPAGYRSPYWELTPYTFNLLCEYGILYDSSCMGDDRPYMEAHRDKEILELPVHWRLDDAIYYYFSIDDGGVMSGQRALSELWLDEFRACLSEGAHITYTMHPHLTGRGSSAVALKRLIETMRREARVWFAPHADVAKLYDRELRSLAGDRITDRG